MLKFVEMFLSKVAFKKEKTFLPDYPIFPTFLTIFHSILMHINAQKSTLWFQLFLTFFPAGRYSFKVSHDISIIKIAFEEADLRNQKVYLFLPAP